MTLQYNVMIGYEVEPALKENVQVSTIDFQLVCDDLLHFALPLLYRLFIRFQLLSAIALCCFYLLTTTQLLMATTQLLLHLPLPFLLD